MDDPLKISNFINIMKTKLPSEYLFCFLAGIPDRSIMTLFSATELLVRGAEQIA
jgi:hypothetical protein